MIRLFNNNTIVCPRRALLMTICLTLKEARGNTIVWVYRGASVLVYAKAGLIIYFCFVHEYIQLQMYKSDKTRS